MVQVLSPNDVAGSTTSSVGRTGHTAWKACTLLLIVVSTITQVGLIVLLTPKSDQPIRPVDSSASGRPSLSLGLLPQSQVNISGASKICGTTSANEVESLGSAVVSYLRTNPGIKISVVADPEMAPSQLSIYRQPAIESPVTSSGSTSTATRRWLWPFKRHAPASLSKESAKKQTP